MNLIVDNIRLLSTILNFNTLMNFCSHISIEVYIKTFCDFKTNEQTIRYCCFHFFTSTRFAVHFDDKILIVPDNCFFTNKDFMLQRALSNFLCKLCSLYGEAFRFVCRFR